MAIEVDRLVATLEARLDKYEKGVAKARALSDKQFTAIEKRGTRMEASLARLGVNAFSGFAKGAIGAVAAYASVTTAVNLTKAALKEFGDIADNAAASGLHPEVYQAMVFQFSQVGVEAGQAAAALTAFAKGSGLSQEETGRMTTALTKLNPALLIAIQNATSQEERLRLVADALSRIEDPARRAATAMAIFGESGGKIATSFDKGAASIDQTMAKARQLGIIVDREMIERADEWGDELDAAWKVVDINLKQAFVELAPLLIQAVQLAGEFAKYLKEASMSPAALAASQINLPNIGLGGALKTPPKTASPFDSTGGGAGSFDDMIDLFNVKIPAAADKAGGSVQRLASSYDAWADDGVQKVIDKHQELADTISGEVVGGIRSIWDAFKSGENVLDAILNKVMDIGEQMLFGGLQSLLSGAGSFGGGWNIPTSHKPGGFFPAFPSFAGGGYTGSGSRSGGMDGQGGFPAMLHPHEIVTDLLKGGAPTGGGQVNNFYIDAKGAEIGVEAKIVRAIQTMVPPMIKSQSPAAVGQASRDRTYG